MNQSSLVIGFYQQGQGRCFIFYFPFVSAKSPLAHPGVGDEGPVDLVLLGHVVAPSRQEGRDVQ